PSCATPRGDASDFAANRSVRGTRNVLFLRHFPGQGKVGRGPVSLSTRSSRGRFALHVAWAIVSSWIRLRFCSFSRNSRPFFTFTWSHGNTSVIGRLRWLYHVGSMLRSRNVFHQISGLKHSRQPSRRAPRFQASSRATDTRRSPRVRTPSSR